MKLSPPSRRAPSRPYTTDLNRRPVDPSMEKAINSYQQYAHATLSRSIVDTTPPAHPVGNSMAAKKLLGIDITIRQIGEGVQGTVYSVQTSEYAKRLEEVRRSLRNVIRGPSSSIPTLSPSTTLAIKVVTMGLDVRDAWSKMTKLQRKKAWSHFLHETVPDAAIHRKLSVATPISIGQGRPELDIRPYVPKFFFSGSDPITGAYVTVMCHRTGSEASANKTTSPGIVAEIERALLTLHAHGVAHADVHEGNVLIGRGTPAVTLLDFGFSVLLPVRIRDRAKRAITDAYDSLKSTGQWPDDIIDDVWLGKMGTRGHVERVMVTRNRVEWYNPNGKYIAHLRETANGGSLVLDRARAKTWGIKDYKLRLDYGNL